MASSVALCGRVRSAPEEWINGPASLEPLAEKHVRRRDAKDANEVEKSTGHTGPAFWGADPSCSENAAKRVGLTIR
jgi:hypothetical protein